VLRRRAAVDVADRLRVGHPLERSDRAIHVELVHRAIGAEVEANSASVA
jgi:hypothetical protein